MAETVVAQHMALRVIDDADLEREGLTASLLILPSAAVLSDLAVDELERFVRAGHGLVASWQLGLYRPDGTWRGYGVLERLFGVHGLSRDSELGDLRFFALHAGHALTAGLPAGLRLEIQPYDVPLLVDAQDPDADWVRWELLPLGENASLRPAAVVHASPGTGRAVWLDFEPAAVPPASRVAMDGLLRNALAWAGGEPLATLDVWPNGAALAAFFALDTEDKFAAASAAADLFEQAETRGTFFCVSALAEANRDTFARLVRTGEIGSHTDDHRVLKGQPAAEQERHLLTSAKTLTALGASDVVGFRPPEEEVDEHTLTAARRAGYLYVAGTRDKDRSEPHLSPEGVVVLPRIPRDDFHWFVHEGVNDPDRLTSAWRADLAQIRRLGGLFFFSFHTQSLDRPALVAGLKALLADTADPTVWRASGAEIATWWRARAGVSVRVEPVDAGHVRVILTARDPVPALGVKVFLPRLPRHLEARVAAGTQPADVIIVPDPEPSVHLVARELRAGTTQIIDLVFDSELPPHL